MLSLKTVVLVAVLFAVTIQLASADIFCNDKGVCIGDGGPGDDSVKCSGCHSCTFKNCCHVRFTNPRTTCNIPGWRSDAYNLFHQN
ncbi:hypothetical protein WR25_21977 [Diploscapter pachys]|uniref:Uncharacterized protein n=1 Tax=Diploscapter pachys TaxID=2018661 RepID=A0A2A2L9R7_9BILA|nr:hypothetical protein WR25_21977 [Diploscapter pachys]